MRDGSEFEFTIHVAQDPSTSQEKCAIARLQKRCRSRARVFRVNVFTMFLRSKVPDEPTPTTSTSTAPAEPIEKDASVVSHFSMAVSSDHSQACKIRRSIDFGILRVLRLMVTIF